MPGTDTASRLEEIAQDLFEVVTQLCLASPRGRRRPGELKEIEFFTLTILQERGTMIVGEIQRLLSILPAQMSRIIRSLENRPEALISCHINPRDKRKINVCLTEAGEKALQDYQAVRVRRIVELLRDLADDEQEQMIRLLDRVRGLLERNPGA
jgi:DNA-binding MarR family transcriptional regulator